MKKILFVSLLSALILFSSSVCAQDYIPRQEFVQMVNSCLDISSDSIVSLPDVKPDSPYFKHLSSAVGYGYVLGDENGNINPYDFLTRAEASVMLGRIMGTSLCENTGYNDDHKIYDWAKPSVKSLSDLKIITGHDDFTFRPDDFLTREQADIIVSRITQNLYAGGKGSSESPYIINSLFHLRNVSINPDKNYKLAADLNLKNCDIIFYPIKSFGGSFDGDGYKIIGLNSNNSIKAVFENVKSAASVINLKLSTPDEYFAIAHKNEGIIENCANISATKTNSFMLDTKYSGNICNINSGSIKNCYNSSFVSYSNGTPSGICGTNEGEIINCFNTGDATQAGAIGICAINSGTIKNCFNTGYLSGDSSRAITLKESKNAPENCYYSSKMFSPGEQKVTQNTLISLFLTSDEFELTQENTFPTLKTNPYYKNENYTEFGGGDGSEINPYIIADKDHFLNIKNHLDAHFKQVRDISFENSYSFEPIGSSSVPFSGSYDGAGFEISNIILYSPLNDNIALFANNAGTIQNVHLKNCIVYGNTNVASLAYNNAGKIIGCSSDAYINCATGSGLVMNNLQEGIISSSMFYGTVSGKQSSSLFAYYNSGTIQNCLALGSVTAQNSGGITYNNDGKIISSCCFGTVSGNKCGLLAFENNGEIEKSYYLEGTTATSSTVRNIEAFPRTKVQAQYKESFELLDFSIWRITDSFPEIISNPKGTSPLENTTDFAGGNGSFSNPFKIVTPKHFVNISKYPSKCFAILNDINLSNISKTGEFKTIKFFSGYLNGNGNKLMGLNQKGISSLIGTNYGIITNLATDSFVLYGEKSAPFALVNEGVITLCRNDSSISGKSVSGITLTNNSIVERCINNGTLMGADVAGIALYNAGKISDCLVSGNIIGNNELSKICGISSGGKILSSIVTSDLYFENKTGAFYPISDTPYSYCYYLDRYNQKWDGYISFSQLMSKNTLYGINFYDIWVNQPGQFPYLNGIKNDNLNVPKTFSAGDGSEERPFVILTLNDLYNIRMYPDAHFTILSDIVAGNLTVTGILNNGKQGFCPIENFKGTINGNNSIIYGLEILYPDLENSGIFTKNSGTIKNLGFSGVRVEGGLTAGAVCGVNYGNIANIKVLDSRIGSKSGDAGAVCGINYGSITSSTNYSDVFAASSGGGIAGVNHKDILNCTNWGGIISVAEDQMSFSGGISGKNLKNIENCVNNGKIFSYSDKYTAYAGGVAGFLEGSVKNSYNTGEHTAKSPSIALAGGIAGGGKDIRISGVYNIGYGLTSSDISYVGSIVGSASGSISNAYYDHTLPAAHSGENISEISVFAISPDDFANLDNMPQFSSSVWVIPKSSTYFYPQLIDNPHISKSYSENVRDFGGGDGSITNPYKILTAEHLDNVRKYLGSSFTLMGNIDMRRYLRQHTFSPIGDNIFGFFGTFMGNGYEIIGLETTDESFGGLFRQNHGEIYDLTISGGNIAGGTAGAICAINTGLIYRCSSSTQISNIGKNHLTTGGIAGINKSSGMIVSCSNTEDVFSSAASSVTGGISGSNYGIIAGSINYGSTSGSGTTLCVAGGLSGYNFGTVSDSANIMSVFALTSSSGETFAGGISGTNSGNLVNCYSAADDVLAKTYGGVTANNTSVVVNCYYNDMVTTPCLLGKCDAFAVQKEALVDKETFTDFDFDEMWYASGIHFPVPVETLY
ncbi:MAG: S-layer homology domain-containing protein [Clostridia bacterium]|nr:S-layer homology domain-containing protein [Clostridia bacterium]